MKTVLLTNDDGYKSAGFLALLEELQKDFEVIAVAPSSNMSWIGKSITAKKKVEVKKVRWHNTEVYSVKGTPADCVQIGAYSLLDTRPDLVVSGINPGANIGSARILSSGTVGAAMEASIDGIRALASSISNPNRFFSKKNRLYDKKNIPYFRNAAKITSKVVKLIFKEKLNKQIELLSLNIPFDATVLNNMAVTRPFREPIGQIFQKKGKHYVNCDPHIALTEYEQGTDLHAIRNNLISLTPLSLELVSGSALEYLKKGILKGWSAHSNG